MRKTSKKQPTARPKQTEALTAETAVALRKAIEKYGLRRVAVGLAISDVTVKRLIATGTATPAVVRLVNWGLPQLDTTLAPMLATPEQPQPQGVAA